MENIKLLILACIALISTCTFAGNTETTKPEFQFTRLEAIQTSWDHALLQYNINDMSTGEVLDIPTFLLNYEVKDNSGKMVSAGSGLYIAIDDTKLTSKEDYTITVSAMINGEKLSRSVCKKASPKNLLINVNNKSRASKEEVSYNVTRSKYSNPKESENVKTTDNTYNTANYEEVTVCNGAICETYKVSGYDKASLKTLQKAIQDLAKAGKNTEPNTASAAAKATNTVATTDETSTEK